MKLHPKITVGQYAITGQGPGYVSVNGRRLEHSLIITPLQLDDTWPVARPEDLQTEHLLPLLDFQCDVVLLGTGLRQRFPSPALLRPLIEARIGVEVMDTAAACRTYHILTSEGRAVVAALIVEKPTP
ncbi:Mth938-like domain-containing protein [Denitratisoma oestradiolicum]|uniref:Xcc1710-like domain-containing protein n=1 Tax=Denitratisoma oestradiolicum TaxID=311182 RepID=A0A6S6Y1Z7_9PROT|nr:Mth938-like domain-containing protein [Denitratisoma oestradiolicum]TWO82271.1 hypothetical protein CBW56_02180 [Denitratisoma oestradiolicum]CAB1369224.1 conserved protein of unknown function [Denitratisoma oestradiolicum]